MTNLDLEIETESLMSPRRLSRRLDAAVKRGSLRHVKALLAMGADPDWTYVEYPPLIVVSSLTEGVNQIPIVKLLLSAGATVSTALWWLCRDRFRVFRIYRGFGLCDLIYGFE